MSLDWKGVRMTPSTKRAEAEDMILFVSVSRKGYFSEVMGADGSRIFRKEDCSSLDEAKKRAESEAMEDLRLRLS